MRVTLDLYGGPTASLDIPDETQGVMLAIPEPNGLSIDESLDAYISSVLSRETRKIGLLGQIGTCAPAYLITGTWNRSVGGQRTIFHGVGLFGARELPDVPDDIQCWPGNEALTNIPELKAIEIYRFLQDTVEIVESDNGAFRPLSSANMLSMVLQENDPREPIFQTLFKEEDRVLDPYKRILTVCPEGWSAGAPEEVN